MGTNGTTMRTLCTMCGRVWSARTRTVMYETRGHTMSSNIDEGQITILVVEDDEGLSRLARKKLSQEGYRTLGVRTGREALDTLKDLPYPILLLDYMLPDMNGEEVITALRKTGSSVPFIMMSGRGSEKIAVDMMKLGAHDYIVKDTGFLDLLPEVVRKTLDRLSTEQRLHRTTQNLLDSENKYQILIENARDAIYILQDGKFVFVNRALCDMFGYTKDELEGSVDYMQLTHPESHDLIRERIERLDRNEDVEPHYEFVGQTTYGDRLYLDANINTIIYRGRPARQGMLRDISERKAEEERKRELEKAKSDFILLVSHELGTPLFTIELNSEELKLHGDRMNPEERDATFRHIDKGIKRLRKLKAFMSNMILLEHGMFMPNMGPVSLTHIARECVEDQSLSAAKKSIELTCGVGKLGMVIADEERIFQVLSTLIENAILYTAAGGRVQVLGRENGEGVILTVKDTGIGIHPSKHEKIFERFYQIQDILQHKDGCGLGLSIAKGVVESHGGRIWVDSAPGQGSSFHILIPRGVQGGRGIQGGRGTPLVARELTNRPTSDG